MHHPEQVFLLDRDAGLLCRILGLYAARGVDLQHVAYTHAAQGAMRLDVTVAAGDDDTAETVRVLVARPPAWSA